MAETKTKQNDEVKKQTFDVGKIEPPKLSRGAKGTRIDRGVLEAMATAIAAGDYATVMENGKPKQYDSRPKANTACVRFKKALVDEELAEHGSLVGRVWGAKNGNEEVAPFYFAVGPKQS